MRYITMGNKVIHEFDSCTVAIANNENGAKIICKALNRYFDGSPTVNECISMMHKNTAKAFNDIANLFENNGHTGEMAIDYLRELSEELNAQALVVSMRDELKFDKPKE
jgi:hypothetical protein